MTGSREWVAEWFVWRALDAVLKTAEELGLDFLLVHGKNRRGADNIAEGWGRKRGVAIKHYPYHSEKGKSGGHSRNYQMCNESQADLALAFNKDQSPGTSGCIMMAVEAGIPVFLFADNGGEIPPF